MAKHKYISQDAAIDAVDVCNLHRGIIDALQAIISDIPAADVRPVVRGKWIDVSPAHIKVFRCDQCGEETTDTCLDKPRANFCPNCGAMMEDNLDTTKGERRDESRG